MKINEPALQKSLGELRIKEKRYDECIRALKKMISSLQSGDDSPSIDLEEQLAFVDEKVVKAFGEISAANYEDELEGLKALSDFLENKLAEYRNDFRLCKKRIALAEKVIGRNIIGLRTTPVKVFVSSRFVGNQILGWVPMLEESIRQFCDDNELRDVRFVHGDPPDGTDIKRAIVRKIAESHCFLGLVSNPSRFLPEEVGVAITLGKPLVIAVEDQIKDMQTPGALLGSNIQRISFDFGQDRFGLRGQLEERSGAIELDKNLRSQYSDMAIRDEDWFKPLARSIGNAINNAISDQANENERMRGIVRSAL